MASSTLKEPFLQDLQFRGFIRGTTIKDKESGRPLCRYFGGIPYAQPPVGDSRWKRPRALEPCYRYGTRADPGAFDDGRTGVCPQIGGDVKLADENCLQCNIWVPVGDRPADGWPVYFYIREC
jgi:carboxylesterase type B